MDLTETLRPHVADIEAAASAGDEGARQIITLYGMCRSCPADGGARVLCLATFESWVAKRDARLLHH